MLLFVSCNQLDDAANNASESRDEIAVGRLLSRKAAASKSRSDYMKLMKESKTFEGKAYHAGKWMKALEFQVWTGQKYDTNRVLLEMYDEAILEFFRAIYDLNKSKNISKSKLSPFYIRSKKKNQAYNLYAMGVTLHLINPVQVTTEQRVEGYKQMSFFDVLKRGLRKIKRVDDGEIPYSSLTKWERSLDEYREEALMILAHRVDMFLTMSLVNLTDLKDKGQISALYDLKAKKNLNSLFPKLDRGKKKITNRYLDGAIKTINFLNEIEQEMLIHKDVRKMYGKLQIDKTNKDEDLNKHLRYLREIFPGPEMKFNQLDEELSAQPEADELPSEDFGEEMESAE